MSKENIDVSITDVKSQSELDVQIGGSHYKAGSIQPVQFIEANNLGFLEGCVVKRITRHNRDGGKGRQDIEKAIHELRLLLELRYPKPAEPPCTLKVNIDPSATPRDGESPAGALRKAAFEFMTGSDIHTFSDAEIYKRKIIIKDFLEEYSVRKFSDIRSSDIDVVLQKLKQANDLLANGAAQVAIHYDPWFASDTNGIYLTWTEPKTDSPNAETDSGNEKFQATEPKCEADPYKAAAPFFKPNPDDVERKLRMPAELGMGYGLGIKDPAKTDSPNPGPPAAEPKWKAGDRAMWQGIEIVLRSDGGLVEAASEYRYIEDKKGYVAIVHTSMLSPIPSSED